MYDHKELILGRLYQIGETYYTGDVFIKRLGKFLGKSFIKIDETV